MIYNIYFILFFILIKFGSYGNAIKYHKYDQNKDKIGIDFTDKKLRFIGSGFYSLNENRNIKYIEGKAWTNGRKELKYIIKFLYKRFIIPFSDIKKIENLNNQNIYSIYTAYQHYSKLNKYKVSVVLEFPILKLFNPVAKLLKNYKDIDKSSKLMVLKLPKKNNKINILYKILDNDNKEIFSWKDIDKNSFQKKLSGKWISYKDKIENTAKNTINIDKIIDNKYFVSKNQSIIVKNNLMSFIKSDIAFIVNL